MEAWGAMRELVHGPCSTISGWPSGFRLDERFSADLIVDMFNIANKMNVSAVSPLFTNAGQATAAYDPRQFQFALKVNW